jgi:hypothetical protein
MDLNKIFNAVRELNLNFSVKETPFSVQISIRKTKVKYFEDSDSPAANETAREPFNHPNRPLELELGALILKNEKQKNEIVDLTADIEKTLAEKNHVQKTN